MEDESVEIVDMAAGMGSTIPLNEGLSEEEFWGTFEQQNADLVAQWKREFEAERQGAITALDVTSRVIDLSQDEPAAAAYVPVVGSSTSSSRPAGKDKRGRRAVFWLFTWNNYVDVEKPMHWPGVKYLKYQEEIGHGTGTPHLQGFVQFETRKRLSDLKKLAPAVHWKPMTYGDTQDMDDYCCKEDTRKPGSVVRTKGVLTPQGQRTDMAEMAQAVVAGKSLAACATENPEFCLKYSKGLQFLRRYARPPKTIREDLVVRLYIGPTGTGKTWRAVNEFEDCYIKGTDKWFDNYIGQDVVVFDDFMGAASRIGLAELLRLLDKYRYQVEVKGGYEWLECKVLILTTNLHPLTWYKYEGRQESYNALMRRFTEIRVFTHRHLDPEIILPETVEFEVFKSGQGYDIGRAHTE